MEEWLWTEHKEEKKLDHSRRDKLQERQKELVNFIESSYEDKLTGKISEEIWKKNTSRWGSEKEKIATEIKSINYHSF